MKTDEDLFGTFVIAWVVAATILFAILLPHALNLPTLPALFFKAVSERPSVAEAPGSLAGLPVAEGPEGLLVHYDFEDGTFAKNHVFRDSSGNSNNAVANGVFISTAPGVIGSTAVSLPGTGYLYAATDPAAGRTNVSFSLWFTDTDETHNYLLAGALSSGTPRTGWLIGTRGSELWDGDGEPVRIAGGTRAAGTARFLPWNHKALVYNGTFVVEYLNGDVVSAYTASGKPLGEGRAMLIGSWQPFGFNYAGRIDDFRIYGRALDPPEVAALYRQGS